ncbi:MAG TPA: organomercurial lyase [Actinomycetes bacterium]|nr:organomercurial lyase [Actinomycetes bacterium]
MTAAIDRLDESLAAATPDLDDEGRRLALALFRRLATGEPAQIDNLVAETGLSLDAAEERLATWPGVFRDERGDVVGFWGIAVPEMDHRLRVGDGPGVHAWCAWDPMFLAPIVGDAEVETHDPVTGETIRYRVGDDGIHDLSHHGSVVSFLSPDGTWDADIVTSFCHYVRHFTSAATGENWVAEHPGTFLLTVHEAAELGRRHAGRLRGDAAGSTAQEAATVPA